MDIEMKNLDRCRKFYEEFGAPMIHEEFGEYEDRIAVGLVGEGSDCFGFDDYISTDHDYGIGFCMWLDDETYNKIGGALQHSYEQMVQEYNKSHGQGVNIYMDARRGVMPVKTFYAGILGMDTTVVDDVVEKGSISDRMWAVVTEDKFATAVNGEVYRDDAGLFTSIRQIIQNYYSEKVWYIKLAEQLYHFSQNVQSNYARMMARHDYVTSSICVAQGMESAMSLIYLINRRFAPYYKWMRKGMNNLTVLAEVGELLDKIAGMGLCHEVWENVTYNPYVIYTEDPVVAAFEQIASLIIAELNRQGIVENANPFLDAASKELIYKVGQMTATQ
jgi:hypothetical protein